MYMNRLFGAIVACVIIVMFYGTIGAAKEVQSPLRVELLWPDGAPGAKGDTEGDKPTLTIYPAPEKESSGTAVVIFPGGGYGHLAVDHEGHQVAQWLNSLGVTAFVLKYR